MKQKSHKANVILTANHAVWQGPMAWAGLQNVRVWLQGVGTVLQPSLREHHRRDAVSASNSNSRTRLPTGTRVQPCGSGVTMGMSLRTSQGHVVDSRLGVGGCRTEHPKGEKWEMGRGQSLQHCRLRLVLGSVKKPLQCVWGGAESTAHELFHSVM